MSPADNHATDSKSENALAAKIILVVLVLLVAWGASFWVFGVPGLYIPAVAVTAIMYVLLITVAKG
ncbi:MAG: hypothetical protein R3D85_16640 [Paracoccaceae bacterium]